jgi:uncharacterized membrane protein YhaH (DUF805 family)
MKKEGLFAYFFRTKGRLGRKPFFLRAFVLPAVYAVLVFALLVWLSRMGMLVIFEGWEATPFLVLMLPAVLANVCLGIRRLHDINLPGAFWLIMWIYLLSGLLLYSCTDLPLGVELSMGFLCVFVVVAFMLYALFAKGSEGTNQYGEAPADGAASSV